ncbi:imidazole glycerol phosphate synthase subunit HisF [bacterium]|nr:imidazole glycerol phosphate synthase subunit HisF [bacterium]
MLTKRIIPCLDVKDGRVVKGTRFVNLKDAGDPVQIASFYGREGADEIIFLDITASFQKRKTMLEVVERTAECTFIPLTVGGGIRNVEDIKDLLNSGADKVSLNTAAVENPSLVQIGAEKFGRQCIVVAVDVKRQNVQPEKWEVFTYGGRKATGIDVFDWIKKVEQLGAGEILLTSMDADGTTEGYDLELTSRISEMIDIPVIASGGAGSLEHISDVLTRGKADAALAASIFHYNKYSIKELKEYLARKGIAVRLN